MLADTNDTVVVGVSGAKGHGKDTSVQRLIDNHGFIRVSFADGLKHALAYAMREPMERFYDPKQKETIHDPSGHTYRHWMQLAGTEWFRSLWGDIWVNWWQHEILDKGYKRVVTTDMRFWNEYHALVNNPHGWKTLTMHVKRPDLPASGDTHASEMFHTQFPYDLHLSNIGSAEDLQIAAEFQIIYRLFGVQY